MHASTETQVSMVSDLDASNEVHRNSPGEITNETSSRGQPGCNIETLEKFAKRACTATSLAQGTACVTELHGDLTT